MAPRQSEEDDEPPTERQVPVGEPVVRADPAVTGDRADEAVGFDPEDPESLARAAETVSQFAADEAGDDNVLMLRGAAACAALVRGEGSYKAAVERADDVPTSFVRKWARVHDLPQSVRRHVARGEIAPSAAKHIARVDGSARLDLAWAVLDQGLTVREVRTVASEVNGGAAVADALRDRGYEPGTLELSLPQATYRELRRQASLTNRSPGDVVADALGESFD